MSVFVCVVCVSVFLSGCVNVTNMFTATQAPLRAPYKCWTRCMHACMCIHTRVHTQARMHVCVHVHTHTCPYTGTYEGTLEALDLMYARLSSGAFVIIGDMTLLPVFEHSRIGR